MNAVELYVAPDTTFTFADWLATTAAGSDAIRDSGKDVVTFVIWTLVIFPPDTVTETVTFPKRDVPVPEYVPSVYVAAKVVDVPEAPTTTAGVLATVDALVDTAATGVAAAAATVAAAG